MRVSCRRWSIYSYRLNIFFDYHRALSQMAYYTEQKRRLLSLMAYIYEKFLAKYAICDNSQTF
jgi:hypothetical protein